MQRRLKAVRDLQNGKIDVLVATDVASRGLNIPNVECVINFDLPGSQYNEYVHRIGRCGRLGHFGIAISFFDAVVDREISVFLKKV